MRTIFASILTASLLVGCQQRQPASDHAAPEAATPTAVEAKTPHSVPALLKEHELTGKVVLVEFGTIGCPLSGSGLNRMIELAKAGTIPGLSFVRLEATADADTVKAYYDGKKPPFPVVRDSKATLAKSLGLSAFPSFALLDKYGHVRYRGGIPTDEDLAKYAQTLVAETADPGEDAAMLGAKAASPEKLVKTTALSGLHGGQRALDAYASTGGLFITFVNVDCPFSNQAVGELPDVTAVLKGYGIGCVLVNLNEPEKTVKEFYKTRNTGATVVYDTCDATQKAWNIDSVPTLVLFNANGKQQFRGPAVWANLAAAATKMLSLPAGQISFEAPGTEYG